MLEQIRNHLLHNTRGVHSDRHEILQAGHNVIQNLEINEYKKMFQVNLTHVKVR